MVASGPAPAPISKSTPLFGVQADNCRCDVAVWNQDNSYAEFSELGKDFVVAFTFKHDDGKVSEWETFFLGNCADHFFNGHVQGYFAYGMVVCGNFEVVAIVWQNLEASCWCTCESGYGVFSAFAGGGCSVNWVDNELDFGSFCLFRLFRGMQMMARYLWVLRSR